MYGIKRPDEFNSRNTSSSPIPRSQVVVYLRSTTGIPSGEEVSISYLSQPCARLDSRRDMLSQAFLFRCNCDRCGDEEDRIKTVSKPPAGVSISAPQQLLRQYATLSSEVEGSISTVAGAAQNGTAAVSQLCIKIDELMVVCRKYNKDRGNTTPLVPSTAHDAALLVLQKSADTSVASASSASPREEYLRLACCAQACSVVTECWSLAGGSSTLSRLEVVAAGGAYCAQMARVAKEHPEVLLVNREDKERHSELVRQFADNLKECVSTLQSVYLPVCNESSSSGSEGVSLHCLVNSDMSQSQAYFENLSQRTQTALKSIRVKV
eukprot:gene21315-27345_t